MKYPQIYGYEDICQVLLSAVHRSVGCLEREEWGEALRLLREALDQADGMMDRTGG